MIIAVNDIQVSYELSGKMDGAHYRGAVSFILNISDISAIL